ncbi:unnamed protein product [Cochlearia groenlandica]
MRRSARLVYPKQSCITLTISTTSGRRIQLGEGVVCSVCGRRWRVSFYGCIGCKFNGHVECVGFPKTVALTYTRDSLFIGRIRSIASSKEAIS